MNLNDNVGVLKGVGEKTREALRRSGIFTLMDLILYFPRTHEMVSEGSAMDFTGNEKFLIKAIFKNASSPVRTRTGKIMNTLNFTSSEGDISALYFNMPYIGKTFRTGESYNLYGKFAVKGRKLSVTNPKVLKEDVLKGEDDEGNTFLARYSVKDGISDTMFRKLINQVLENVSIRENLHSDLTEDLKLLSLDEALNAIHNPQGETFDDALRRLKFQELFSYSLKLLSAREMRMKNLKGLSFKMSPRLLEFKNSLPFELTGAQSLCIREILLDQKKEMPMNRLLQGDVGSGKTAVAITSLFNILENGYQAILMVPTEILAEQHFEDAVKLLSPFGYEPFLLTGSTKKKERDKIIDLAAKGEPILVIGTHALLQDDVVFKKLGMAVTDEQHRFGVAQRMKLTSRTESCEVLVMSATPIPRTLAMHLYSDLDLSVINELPPGRKPVKTRTFSKAERKNAYLLALEEVNKGRQVYIVCPLIEENEDLKLTSTGKLYEELKSGIFWDKNIAMIHGRMKAKEKNEVMEQFKKGTTEILISTTVIEVGVNVPNATVMIVENSERFGLSQLHQLRGRVGRGEYESSCFLLRGSESSEVRKRLNIMTSTNDGFKVAEEDLKMRGTGSLFGLNQSGDSGLRIADFINDYGIFLDASRWAGIVFNDTTGKYSSMKDEILKKLEESMKYFCLN